MNCGRKGREEHRRLRVEQGDDEAVAKDRPEPRGREHTGIAGRARGEQHLYAEVDKVKRSRILDDHEGQRGGPEQRRQPDGCADGVAEVAERHAGDRCEPEAPALQQAARDDVEDTGAGGDGEDEARDQECGEQWPRREEIAH
jgi:hypothetical protein